MMFRFLLISLTAALCRNVRVEAFSPLAAVGRPNKAKPIISHQHDAYAYSTTSTTLNAAADGKKKRRRKQPPGIAEPDSNSNSDPSKASLEKVEALEDEDDIEDMTEEQVVEMDKVANFKFRVDGATNVAKGVEDDELATQDTGGAIPLPDIKQALRKKEMEEEIARMAEEKEEKKVRIKRTDKEAFRKLLEQQPFADADASYFEEEKYGTVSALLGEGAKPFLGIPLGPLQVGHFTMSLGIMLMAFVEYPGFPLTNLPTPIRDALQGGLGVVYAVNIVLAVIAATKCPERGQPIPLWVAKTVFVGGVAYDQLTQLPTLEEIEAEKNRKGARAAKNKKK